MNRFTISTVSDQKSESYISDKELLLILINERKNKLSNPYSPLAIRLKELTANVENKIVILEAADKDVILEVFDFYIQNKLDKENVDVGKFVTYAEIMGEIGQAGKKYEENIRVYDLKDKIKDFIKKQKTYVYNLRKKLLQ